MCRLCVGSPENILFPVAQEFVNPEGGTTDCEYSRVGAELAVSWTGGVGKHCMYKEGDQGTWEGPEASVIVPVQGCRRD